MPQQSLLCIKTVWGTSLYPVLFSWAATAHQLILVQDILFSTRSCSGGVCLGGLALYFMALWLILMRVGGKKSMQWLPLKNVIVATKIAISISSTFSFLLLWVRKMSPKCNVQNCSVLFWNSFYFYWGFIRAPPWSLLKTYSHNVMFFKLCCWNLNNQRGLMYKIKLLYIFKKLSFCSLIQKVMYAV